MKTTKELARELGLLRKRTLSAPLLGSKNSRSPCQVFGYLIVLDFESTCWKDKKFQTQEIIEFPAVLLNTSTGEIESEFHHYIQPQEQPVLSEFCRELTGITQEQVEDGIPLRLCLRKFSKWLDGLCRDKGITFSAPVPSRPSSKAATFVTWSDWDLGVCLLNECRRKQLLKPSPLNSWIDLRATYRKFYNRRPQGLNGALQDLGITFEGREHSGLHDARNTATLAWRMTQDGCVLANTKTLQSSGETGKAGVAKVPPGGRVSDTLPDGRPKAATATCATTVHKILTSVHNQNSPSRSPCEKKRKTETRVSPRRQTDSKIPVSSPARKTSVVGRHARSELSSPAGTGKSKIPIRSPRSTASRNILTTTKTSIADQIYKDPVDDRTEITQLPRQPSTNQQISSGLTSRDTNSSCNNNNPLPKLTPSRTSSWTSLKQTPQICNIANTNTCPTVGTVDKSTYTGLKPMSSTTARQCLTNTTTFKTPSPVGVPKTHTSNSKMISPENSTVQRSFSSMSGYVTPSNSNCGSSFRTPSTTSSSMKVTPPLCQCGRRSKRRMAQTPGPNMGRFFFSCGSGSRPSNPQDRQKGCRYFQWESPVRTENNSSFQKSFNGSNTSFLPFKQVGQVSGFSQRRSLGVRPAVVRPPIR